MQSRDFKPPEERTSPVPFFILGLIMVAVTFWTVWDETFSRRPWKEFQKNFNAYERSIVEKDLAEARKSAAADLAKIDVQIKTLKEKLAADSELPALQKKHEQLKLDAFEKGQEFGFAKAIYDQAYFEFSEALRQGHDTTEEKERLDAARKEMLRLEPIAKEAESARDEVQARIEAKKKSLADLEKQKREAARAIDGLERRLAGIAGRPYEIDQLVLREFERNNFGEPVMKVDRCQTCHRAIDRAGFEDAPQPFRTHPKRSLYLKKHDIQKVGCTSCHGGQGSAVTSVEKAHGYVEFWEDPLLKGPELQTKCRGCHSEVFNIPEAPHISRGISLVRELGCFGCHRIPETENLRKVGPNLSRIQEKVYPGWLVSWVKRPRDYNPRTKMPYFSFSEREALDIATYVWGTGSRKAPSEKIEGLEDPAAVQKGKALFESVGCLGCHVRGEADVNPGPPLEDVKGRPLVIRNRDFAPALGKIGKKVQPDWLYRWLKNPKAYWHDTVMPSLRLSDEEAKALAAYLLSLSPPDPKAVSMKLGDAAAFERGKNLVAKRGCFGCHVIPGTETLSKIGPDLTAFATKRPFQLDFGNVVNIPKTWAAWTFGKLKNPKIYQTDRIELRMPNFDLADNEAIAIRTLLRAMTPHEPPVSLHDHLDTREARVEGGRRMIEKYNCSGCHVVENWGGNLLRRYKEKNDGPPYLTGEGEKIQPDWFYAFLRNVVTLRPWLKVRMPSFQMPGKDAAALVDYFAAVDGKLQPYVHFDPTTVKPETIAAAQRLMKLAECLSCHGEWPPPPGQEPPSAPNLLFAKNRLRPDWIFRWIRNPSKIRPGTKMPTFFQGAGLAADVVRGTRTEQEDGKWVYVLETAREAELPEGQFATLRIGEREVLVRVTGIEEKKVTISSPADLGNTIGKGNLESHGEPIIPEILGGDAYKQIRAIRDFLMVASDFSAVAVPKKGAKPATSSPQTKARPSRRGG